MLMLFALLADASISDPVGVALAIVTAVFSAVGAAAVWFSKFMTGILDRFDAAVGKLTVALAEASADHTAKLDELRDEVTALRHHHPIEPRNVQKNAKER